MTTENIEEEQRRKKMIICHLCKKELNSWDIRCSKALGYKNPICEICIAKEYGKTKEELREIMEDLADIKEGKTVVHASDLIKKSKREKRENREKYIQKKIEKEEAKHEHDDSVQLKWDI